MIQDALVEYLKAVASPTDYLIEKFTKTANAASDTAPLDDLYNLAKRREVEMRISEAEARVAQELAIAKRIENADEVEMTEFYEYAGEGQIGVKAQADMFSIGTSGSGRRISKRKFKFKGGASVITNAELSMALEEVGTKSETGAGPRP